MPQANIAIPYEELIMEARHHVEDFVVDCRFAGKPCGDITQVFEPVISNLRMCYNFNSGRVSLPEQSKATGR